MEFGLYQDNPPPPSPSPNNVNLVITMESIGRDLYILTVSTARLNELLHYQT